MCPRRPRWRAGARQFFFWSNDHWSDRAGDTATFTSTGTRIALRSLKDTSSGIAAIRTGETLQYLRPRPAYGTHTDLGTVHAHELGGGRRITRTDPATSAPHREGERSV